MKLFRGSLSYTAASTGVGSGISTVQTANFSAKRAMIAASPGIGPAFTRPFGIHGGVDALAGGELRPDA